MKNQTFLKTIVLFFLSFGAVLGFAKAKPHTNVESYHFTQPTEDGHGGSMRDGSDDHGGSMRDGSDDHGGSMRM